jgi:hypothetical protein
LVGIVGNADCAGAGQRLYTGGDIHPIAVNVALVDDDVTDVDTDAEFDPTIFRNVGVAFSQSTLDFYSAAHSIDCARKFDQNAITGGFDDAAPMLRNLGINEFATAGLECGESAFLVNAHQAAVTSDISSEDGSQTPFDPRLGHENCP